jgi:hypothetical protein
MWGVCRHSARRARRALGLAACARLPLLIKTHSPAAPSPTTPGRGGRRRRGRAGGRRRQGGRARRRRLGVVRRARGSRQARRRRPVRRARRRRARSRVHAEEGGAGGGHGFGLCVYAGLRLRRRGESGARPQHKTRRKKRGVRRSGVPRSGRSGAPRLREKKTRRGARRSVRSFVRPSSARSFPSGPHTPHTSRGGCLPPPPTRTGERECSRIRHAGPPADCRRRAGRRRRRPPGPRLAPGRVRGHAVPAAHVVPGQTVRGSLSGEGGPGKVVAAWPARLCLRIPGRRAAVVGPCGGGMCRFFCAPPARSPPSAPAAGHPGPRPGSWACL